MTDIRISLHQNEAIATRLPDGKRLARCERHSDAFQVAAESAQRRGGARIEIGTGTYRLDRPIELPAATQLAGAGRSCVLAPTERNRQGVAVRASGQEGVIVRDLVCKGDYRATEGSGIVFDDCFDSEIAGVHARDFPEYGLLLCEHSFMNRLTGNTTSGNGGAGVCLENCSSGRGGDWAPNLIANSSSIGERGHAYRISKAFCVNIVGCQAYQPKGHGFLIENHANSVCITGSRCYQGHQNGILVSESHEINISSNIVCWNKKHGIELAFCFWGTVSANNAIDNGARTPPPAYGIYLHSDCRSIQVSCNAVFNWPGHQPMLSGIRETADCKNNQISNNNIHRCSEQGIAVEGQGSEAAQNVLCPKTYPHPSHAPPLPLYATEEEHWGNNFSAKEEFTDDRVQSILAKMRR